MKRLVMFLATMTILAGSVLLSAKEELPAFFHSSRGAVNPWSNLDFNADPANFQFAIVTDRTGGHRAMVFQNAVRKLNILQPEFVISVGDLIEGGTRDRDRVDQEWKEFNGFIKRLDMPFFYTPGNHDISNKMMQGEWISRFGRRYHHFLYKDCLFLVLDSEAFPGGPHSESRLGSEQVTYAHKVLVENAQVRWTFVFVHKPLWSYGSDGMGTANDWQELERSLAGRKFTAFCGHHHRYQTWTRNGNKYIQLATTGGSSKKRGKEFGEFDQVAWVTMSADGPVLANLLLDGIVSFDVQGDLEYDKQVAAAQKRQQEEKAKRKAAKQRTKVKAK